MALVFKLLAILSIVTYLVLWRLHAKRAAKRIRVAPLGLQEIAVIPRSDNPRACILESLDAADVVEVAMRTHNHEVEARLLAAQNFMMNEVLQFQDCGVILAVVRAASSVDYDCQ